MLFAVLEADKLAVLDLTERHFFIKLSDKNRSVSSGWTRQETRSLLQFVSFILIITRLEIQTYS
jgi:hypothetical protein